MKESNSQAFRRGFRDGIPIGLGYLAGLLFNRYRRKKYRPECISGIPYESVK